MRTLQHFRGRLIRVMLSATIAVVLVGRAEGGEGMQYPVGVAAAGDGTLFIADRNGHCIWKAKGGTLEKFFEGSSKFGTPMNAVRCVAIDHQGKLLAGDSATREVYRFDESGKPTPLTNGGIGIPMAIAVRASGEILVSDLELQCIWKVAAEGGTPVKLAPVAGIVGICLDADDVLWVVSRSQQQLRRVSADGKVENALEGQPFSFPHNLVLDQNKTAYVTDNYAKAVWKVVAGKAEKYVEGNPLVSPVGIARQGDSLLIADPHAKSIFQIDAAGKTTKIVPAG
ncbi:MAG: hypothetical protein FJ276_12940 [Planctomycetes bacterium]|nr:hypothetical protein [Planctomycetota bacterium]